MIVRGKLLLREMQSITADADWDDPLPEALYGKWTSWVNSLKLLEHLHIQRMYSNISFGDAARREVLVYSDTSKDVIVAVAYLRLHCEELSSISFLLGKVKVSPMHGHTVPRLELWQQYWPQKSQKQYGTI